jgi:cytochrome b pre-mRNA-processing protein 3
MMLARWRARRASNHLIEQLRGEIVAASRRPALYARLKAPDRLDGRFELLTLHAGLVLRRLVALDGLGRHMAQDLVNSLFLHFDDTLREMALSDIAVSRRLRTMKKAFYGRSAAYAAALDSGSKAELEAAIARNVYAGADPSAGARALAGYVASLATALAATPLEDFATGRFRFPDGRIETGD